MEQELSDSQIWKVWEFKKLSLCISSKVTLKARIGEWSDDSLPIYDEFRDIDLAYHINYVDSIIRPQIV